MRGQGQLAERKTKTCGVMRQGGLQESHLKSGGLQPDSLRSSSGQSDGLQPGSLWSDGLRTGALQPDCLQNETRFTGGFGQTGVFRSAADKMMNLLFPPDLYCICCGNLIDETRTYHLCDHCLSHIHWDGGEARVIGGLKTLRCAQYGLYERTLIFALKYNGKKYIARDLAEMMEDRLALAEQDFDIIVPVPMFSEKERRRGFNQAALMGRYLGRRMGKPCAERALLRTADTRPMRGLSPTERKVNVKDKFALCEKYAKMLEGKKVLLIDDFYTTGSTAEACFEALQKAGPQEVCFLAFAAK